MSDTERRLVFEAYGVVCAVTIGHAHAPDACGFADLDTGITERLPPGAHPRPDDTAPVGEVGVTCRGEEVSVTDGDGATRVTTDAAECLHVVDGAIRSIVAVHAPGLVFIHAGAVAIDGRAVVLPGRSMAGKTTLVGALVEAGATYLSDEYAVIDSASRVHPYPRRLSMRVGDARREVAASDLGGTVASGPLPVGLVAAVHYEAGTSWHTVPAGEAACADVLISNAVAARARSDEVLQCAARVARSTRYVEGTRGDAGEAVDGVFGLVASRPDGIEAADPVRSGTPAGPGDPE